MAGPDPRTPWPGLRCKRWGFAPAPTKRLRLLELRQGQRPLEPVNGLVLRGGPTVTYQRQCWPSPENKPQLIDRKGPRPLLGVQDWAAKSGPISPWRVQGGARPFISTGDCPRTRAVQAAGRAPVDAVPD